MSSFPISITELDRDRFAREAQVKVNSVTLRTPHFSPIIKTRDEFQLFLRMKAAYHMNRVRSCTIRLFDAPSIVLPRIQASQQKTISGSYVDEDFRSLSEDTFVMIDPATEYLHYEANLQRFNSSKALPGPFREYARVCENKKLDSSSEDYAKWKDAYHRLFWTRLRDDPRSRSQLVGETLDLELKCLGTVALAPVPIIDSMPTLTTALEMNRLARQLSRFRAVESATYFILHKNALADERLIDELKSQLERVETKLTVFKIKGLDLTESNRIVEREAYRELLIEMALIRQRDPSRCFVLLEGENQTFPSAAVAFDIVATSLKGQDGDISGGQTPYGKWYDPKEMMLRSYDQVQRMFKLNGRLPHACPICKRVTDISSVSIEQWNSDRRLHYCFCMQEFMDMIGRAIKDRNVELARDMIINSSISVLKSLIPRS